MQFNILNIIMALVWAVFGFVAAKIFSFLVASVVPMIGGSSSLFGLMLIGFKWLMYIFLLFIVPYMQLQGKIDGSKIAKKIVGE